MLPKKNTSVATLALLFSLIAVPRAIAGSPALGSNITPISAPSALSLVRPHQPKPSGETNLPTLTLSQNSPNFPKTAHSQLSAQWWGILPLVAIVGLVWGWYRSQTPKTQPDNKKYPSEPPDIKANVSQQLSNEVASPQTESSQNNTEPLDTVAVVKTVTATETASVGTDSGAIATSEAIEREHQPQMSSTEIEETSATPGNSSALQPEEMAKEVTSTPAEIQEHEVEPTPSDQVTETIPQEPSDISQAEDDSVAVSSPQTHSTADPYPAFDETPSRDNTSANIEAAKFNLGQTQSVEPRLASVDEGLTELPDGYGKTKIVLMPREPNSAYAYWDIPNEDKEKLRQLGGEQLALRFYDVTGIDMDQQKPHSVRQYDCEEMTREWYIEVPTSDRDYIVEIGYVTEDGRWLRLARSLHVRIPPVYPCEWYGDDFKTVHWEENLHQ